MGRLTVVMSSPYLYDSCFYDTQADESGRSADIVVPVAYDLLTPTSLLDVGCGVGTWIRSWQQSGVADVLGIDGDYLDRTALRIAPEHFQAHDLSTSFDLGRRFDLVTTFEVAEHLPASSAAEFVTSLTRHADAVLFSAAIPGQAGTGHINCQWQSYWAEIFAREGYVAVDIVRPRIWTEKDVAAYYRQNVILYVTPARLRELGLVAAEGSIDRVHPEVYAARVLVPLRKTIEHRLRSYNVRTRIRAAIRR